MRFRSFAQSIIITSFALVWQTAFSDDLTMMVEENLSALGYQPGPVDGVETMDTTIAISKFQAENNLDVTGEVTPQLAGVLAAKVDARKSSGETASNLAPAAPARTPQPTDPDALRKAQQACLERKMAETQEAQKKKRGFGRLLSAIGRVAGHTGNAAVSTTVQDVYTANATADDLAAAAKDLGLTEEDIEACRNPSQ